MFQQFALRFVGCAILSRRIRGWIAKLDAIRRAARRSIRNSSRPSRANGRIRFASTAATLRLIRSAIRDGGVALDRGRCARRVSRRRPVDGLAVRGRARPAGAQPLEGAVVAGANRNRTSCVDCGRRRDRRGSSLASSRSIFCARRRCRSDWVRAVPSHLAASASALGCDARQLRPSWRCGRF